MTYEYVKLKLIRETLTHMYQIWKTAWTCVPLTLIGGGWACSS